jgi:hypothetical protein
MACFEQFTQRRSLNTLVATRNCVFSGIKQGKLSAGDCCALCQLRVFFGQLCHVCWLMICFRNVHDGNDRTYIVQVDLFVVSESANWSTLVIILQVCDKVNRVSLDLSVQFKWWNKHLSHTKAQGTLIYRLQNSPHEPHDAGVSGAAPSLCSSRARHTTASPSRFC